MKSMNLIATN